jgi:hypothetical protein
MWDVIYEHCSYFTGRSLSHIFTRCGYRILDLETAFGTQFLCIEAQPTGDGGHTNGVVPEVRPDEIGRELAGFRNAYDTKVGWWRDRIERIAAAGRRAVIWGAGSKGVTFLNALRPNEQIRYAVDISPRKTGMHVPGTGQRIVPPGFLGEYRPDVVIVMNEIYQQEIRQVLTELGLQPEILNA